METTSEKKAFKNAWQVQCFSCGAMYIDHRRRVGKCLKCKSVAIIAVRK